MQEVVNSKVAEGSAMVDEREEFLAKWMESLAPRDGPAFYSELFSLVEADERVEAIFLANLPSFLTSSHRNLESVFEFCLSRAQKRYNEVLVSFLADYLDQKKSIFLSLALETHIIHKIWHPSLVGLAPTLITPYQVIVFLSLKMRSLELKIRKEALDSLFNLVEATGNVPEVMQFMSGWIEKLLPEMIEKQKYGKEVCFYRGVLLQILQDESCLVKKKGLEFLGLSQRFFDIRSIRPLILYMLNDEHREVRETSLAMLSALPSLDLEKEDLSALVVCLRENNIELRSRTYQNIAHINVTSSADFQLILKKLFESLQTYKEDKRKIYTTFAQLGVKFPNYVLGNLNSIYNFMDGEEPNWKGLAYKAKVILVASVGKQFWPATLPKYFPNHYLYIRDIEMYAFEALGSRKDQLPLSGKAVSFDGKTRLISPLRIDSTQELIQFLSAYSNVYSGFLKDFFCLSVELAQQIRQPSKNITGLFNQIKRLYIQYNLSNNPHAANLVSRLQAIGSNMRRADPQILLFQLNTVGNFCLANEEKLLSVESNIFKASSHDRSKILITNNPTFINQSFLQFSNSLGSHGTSHLNIKNNSIGVAQEHLWRDKDFQFIRMSEVEFEQKDDRFCYYTIDFRWKRLRCVAIYGSPIQAQTTDALVVM